MYAVGDELLAVNRSVEEDLPATVDDARVAGLFERLEFDRVDDQAGSGTSLMEEIWRTFLALMMAALLLEACLCLPKITTRSDAPSDRGFDAGPKAVSTPSGNGQASKPAGVSA